MSRLEESAEMKGEVMNRAWTCSQGHGMSAINTEDERLEIPSVPNEENMHPKCDPTKHNLGAYISM